MSEKARVTFPSRGVRGRVFLPLFLAILLGISTLGLFILQPPATVVDQTLANSVRFVFEFLVKLIIAFAVTLGHSWMFFSLALGTPLSRLRGRFEKSHNDSHAYLLLGIAGAAVVALSAASGANLTQYLYMFSTRGVLGYAVGLVLTMLIARAFGAGSMEEFRDWIDTEDNDSYAILVAGVHVLAMILAMSV